MKHAAGVPALLFLLFFSLSAGAQTLSVEKYTENKNIKAGDDVTISLHFSNPFGKEIAAKIVDKNLFGESGIDVQCLEFTIPAQKDTAISYQDTVKPSSSGNFTIDAAAVTYTNPVTGKEETARSNTLDVSVADPAVAQQGTTQAITTLYQCGGVTSKSTSVSSSSPQNQNQQQTQNQQNQNPQSQQQQQQSRVQNNQMAQNLNSLKQDMQKQQEEQKKMEDAFNRNVENNSGFQKQQEELAKQGYKPADSKVRPTSNDSGSFEKSYKNEQGENASIKGQMENGKMTDMQTQTAQDRKNMEDVFNKNLENNPDLQQQQSELAKEGYKPAGSKINASSNNSGSFEKNYQKDNGENASIKGEMKNGNMASMQTQTSEDTRNALKALQEDPDYRKYDSLMKNGSMQQMQPQVTRTALNKSKITVPYKNQTSGEITNITADYLNGSIKNVSLQQEKKGNDQNIIILVLAALFAVVAFYFAYRKYFVKNHPKNTEGSSEEPLDFRRQAMEMINAAGKLFSEGREKDAYEKVSQAVRFYFSHKLEMKKDISSFELLETLKKDKREEYNEVRECLDLCGLVEFAKYTANKEDFDKIVSSARKAIV